MNKTKYMLVGFAVFASILMLTTTCIAGPVQEKASIDAVESAQEELMKSFEALFLKMENDRYLNSLKDQISKDRTLNSIVSAIENTEDSDAKASLASSYVDALKNSLVFNNLAAYFERSYSKDIQGINAQFNEFSDVFESYYQSSNTETEDFEIVGAIPYPYGSPFQNNEPVIGGSGIDGAYSNGNLCLVSDGSHTILPSDSAEAQWGGFVRNMNGEMYIPGMGWVDAEEYGWLEYILIRIYFCFTVATILILIQIVIGKIVGISLAEAVFCLACIWLVLILDTAMIYLYLYLIGQM